jgi:hypothetical protein
MSNYGKRNIIVALIVTLVAAGLLYLLMPESPATPPFANPVQPFWSDDLNDWFAIDDSQDVAHNFAGIVLSHIQPLDRSALQDNRPLRADDRICRTQWNGVVLVSDASRRLRELPSPFPRERTVGSTAQADGGRLYGVGNTGYRFDDKNAPPPQLLVYDPRTAAIREIATLSRTVQLLFGPGQRLYGFDDSVWPSFVYDPATDTFTQLTPPTNDASHLHRGNMTLGNDGLVYGVTYFKPVTETAQHPLPWRYAAVALDLTNRQIITAELPEDYWHVIARPDTGIYLYTSKEIWAFDPKRLLTPVALPAELKLFYLLDLEVDLTGRLIGYAYGSWPASYAPEQFLFALTPSTGKFELIEFPDNSGDLFTCPEGRIYTYGLGSLQLDTFRAQGDVESEIIKPISLVLTRTVIGNASAEARALVCGANGQLYGVTSKSEADHRAPDRGWLFEYDPNVAGTTVTHIAPAVSDENIRDFLGGTALTMLNDGRLVGGTNNGHLFIYDPATRQTVDVGRPTTRTWQIAALTTGRDGLVYGGTSSYYYGQAALFTFDPALNMFAYVITPLTKTYMVGAVTAAPDGRIYAGFDNRLVIFDPAQRRLTLPEKPIEPERCQIRALITHPNGKIYGGCSNHLFSYDPVNYVINDLGKPDTRDYDRNGTIAALVVGNDGRVYGSLDFKYESSHLFVFDPASGQLSDWGVVLPTGVSALTTCGDGTIYGGTGTWNSGYSGPSYLFAFRTECTARPVGTWGNIVWEADTPLDTSITVDVLTGVPSWDKNAKTLIANVRNGQSLAEIDAAQYPAIRLRANLSTFDPHVTPMLKHWRVTYDFLCIAQLPSPTSTMTQK